MQSKHEQTLVQNVVIMTKNKNLPNDVAVKSCIQDFFDGAWGGGGRGRLSCMELLPNLGCYIKF